MKPFLSVFLTKGDNELLLSRVRGHFLMHIEVGMHLIECIIDSLSGKKSSKISTFRNSHNKMHAQFWYVTVMEFFIESKSRRPILTLELVFVKVLWLLIDSFRNGVT